MKTLPESNIPYHTKTVTAKELIDTVVTYYSNPARRSLTYDSEGEPSGCAYQSTEGKMCAVGLFIEDHNKINGVDIARALHMWTETSLEDILKKPYKGFPIELWHSLQEFHDEDSYFLPQGGLTNNGMNYVERLYNIWA